MTKVRSLLVRPIQSVDLAFVTSGVLGFHNRVGAALGARLDAVDRERVLTAAFGKPSANDPSVIAMGPDEMRAAVGDKLLFALDNGELATELAAAMGRRTHAYLSRFQFKTALLQDIREIFPPGASPTGRLARLEEMRGLMDTRHTALATAYGNGAAVVAETKTTTTTEGRTETEVRTRPLGLRSSNPAIRVTGGGADITHTPTAATDSIPLAFKAASGWEESKTELPDTFTEKISTAVHPEQTTKTPLVELRHPALEEKIDHQRAHLALQDEWLRARSFQHQTPNLEKIWDLELAALDLEVARLQHQLSHGMMLSPISGTVTAIYKDIGEHVAAGEPVLRVENDRTVLLVGVVQHTNAVTIGMAARVVTSDLYEGGDKVELSGKIVSVRGHDSDNDEWEIIISVENESHERTLQNGQKDRVRLPINYHFDKDQTSIELRL